MNIPLWLSAYQLPDDVIAYIESYISSTERETYENAVLSMLIVNRPNHKTLRALKNLGVCMNFNEKQKERLNDYLLEAVGMTYTFLAELLLEMNADVNYFGTISLDTSVWKQNRANHTKNFKALHDFHESKPFFKYNPLLISILNQQLEMTQLLVRFKCDLNAPSVYTRVGYQGAYSSYPSSSQDNIIPLLHAITAGDASTNICIVSYFFHFGSSSSRQFSFIFFVLIHLILILFHC